MKQVDLDMSLVAELENWFLSEAGADGDEGSLLSILDDRYQDDGFTSGLYMEMTAILPISTLE